MKQEFQDYLFKYWRYNYEDVCSYCSNYVRCEGENCPKFVNYGKQGYMSYPDDKEPKKVILNYDVTCMDTDFGKCPLLENTKCNNCVETLYSNFLWNGKIPDKY